jgi:hypothetical protein
MFITHVRDWASAGIHMVLGYPLVADGAKVVNVDGALGENDRYPENASERCHDDGHPYPTAH